MKNTRILSFRNILLLLILAALSVCFSLVAPFNTLEKRLLNLSFLVRGAETPHESIVIIEVNDESLRLVGTWPWPRSFHGQFLKILALANPKVIFFDMLFPEKSSDQNDQLFAEGMKEAGNVILPYYFPVSKVADMKDPAGLPIELLRKEALSIGYANVFNDQDGYVREIPLRHSYRENNYYHLSAVIAGAFLNWDDSKMRALPEKPLLINYPGPYEGFQRIPYQKVIAAYGYPEGKTLLEYLKGKVILVGHTATGTGMDLKPTAYSPHYYGVGLIASMVHTILSDKFIQRLHPIMHGAVLFLFLLMIAVFTQNKSPVRGFLFTFASLLIIFEIIQVSFIYFRLWVPFGTFLVSGMLVFLSITLYSFVVVQLEKEMYSRELSLATKIQSNLLRSEMPVLPWLEISAMTHPARHVGGDLYDIVQLDRGLLGICIGDVSGKGVPAALFMSKAISEFRREVPSIAPGKVVKALNTKLSEGGFSGLFITLLYVLVDPETKTIRYSNGGHEPLFFYRKRTNTVELLTTDEGSPLGIDTDSNFDEKQTSAEPGDILLMESDGIKEAMNAKKELFGLERIQAAIIEAKDQSAAGIAAHLEKRVQEFVKNAPQHDDMTIVCAKFV